MISEFAPAKINLYLHITGRRADGYHQLDSLTAFAGVGDEVRLEVAPRFDFMIEGPQAERLRGEATDKNLVVRMAEELAARTGKALDLRLTLIKNLPVASGIGGGSSDAAAALRALATHWGLPLDDPRLLQAAETGGQDVPVCLHIRSCYITPEGTTPGPQLPYADIVLVNPNRALPTADVYRAYKEGGHGFSPPAPLPEPPNDAAELAQLLKARHNDLAPPALELMPVIGEVLQSIETSTGCLLARMSGSGATCFGLYGDRDQARKAAADILAAHPGWWVIQSHIPKAVDRRRRI